jgi:hypothetical protein
MSADDILVGNNSVDGCAHVRVSNQAKDAKETNLYQIHWGRPG